MKRAVLFLVFSVALFSAEPAAAYMGPGAGLGMIGSLLALLGAGAVAVLGLLILPVRMLIKRMRKTQPPAPVEPR